MAHEHNEPEPTSLRTENGDAKIATSSTNDICYPPQDKVQFRTTNIVNTHYKNGQIDRVASIFSLQRVIDRCSTIELMLKRLYRRAKGENAQEQSDIPISD